MKERKHSLRPKNTKLEGSWGCRCGTINLGTDSVCKRIEIDRVRQLARVQVALMRHERENWQDD